MAGVPCTNGTEFFKEYVPNKDASIVKALRRAGAVILGKLTFMSFVMGQQHKTRIMAGTCNPWDLQPIPSGSSGGAAAALASGMCVGAIGSDTGGLFAFQRP